MEGSITPGVDLLGASLTLGRRSLRPAAWILLVVALAEALRAYLSEECFHGTISLNSAPELLSTMAAATLAVLSFAILSVGFLYLLPLLDGLAHGRTPTAGEAIRVVMRKVGALTVLSLVQSVVLIGPPAILLYITISQALQQVVAAGASFTPEASASLQAAVFHRVLGPSYVWLFVTNMLLLFALPYLLLENRGPLRSVALSTSLVFRRAIPEWSWLLVFLLLAIVLTAAVLVPELAIRSIVAPLPWNRQMRSILLALWSGGATAVMLTYGAASMILLFRHLVPAEA